LGIVVIHRKLFLGEYFVMQEAGTNITSARLNELMDSISEARRLFENWQDQKTETLIRLDSFSYDIQKIEEDRMRLESRNQEAKKEFDGQVRIYQGQVADLTDQLQLLKFEMEGLKNQATDRELVMDGLRKDLENQKKLKEQLSEHHARKVLEVESDWKNRHDEAMKNEKKIQEGLVAQIADFTQRRSDDESKIERLQRDLNHIRSHMLGVLQGAPTKNNDAGVERANPSEETLTIQSIANSENSATVEDYLKRLGY